MIIDNKGRLFGKWNIVDVIVILFFLCIIPATLLAWRILNKPIPLPEPSTHYSISKSCPNCGYPHSIKIKKGELMPSFYSGVCENCKNEVVYIITPPIEPKKVVLSEDVNYLQEYYKRALEKGLP